MGSFRSLLHGRTKTDIINIPLLLKQMHELNKPQVKIFFSELNVGANEHTIILS